MTRSSFPVILTGAALDRCIVVGGGTVAERKVRALLDGDAQVHIISPTLTAGLQELATNGAIELSARPYHDGDLPGATLVVAATDDRATNAAIADEARRLQLLVDVVDDPGASTFSSPATIRRGDLLITASTGGTSPAMAAFVRRTLEQAIGPEYGALLALCGRLRSTILDEVPPHARKELWEQLASERMLRMLREASPLEAEAEASRLIAAARSTTG